jgi:hypothetical protein
VPAAYGILQPFELRYELEAFGGSWRKFSRVPGALYYHPIPMEYILSQRPGWARNLSQHLPSDYHGIEAGIKSYVSASPSKTFANFSKIILSQHLAQPFLTFCTKFDQCLHKLRLAARFLRNLQTAQGRKLHIHIAHLSRPLANAVQHFHDFLLITVATGNELFEQRLQSTGRGAEAVHSRRLLSG